jgi:hypothetical protein
MGRPARRIVMRRTLVPAPVTALAAVIAVVLLVPAATPAQDKTVEKSPYVADCKGLESTLAMARTATRAITLDQSSCNDLTGDDKSRCRKTIRGAYDTALQTAHNAEKAAQKVLACCQKPDSKECRAKPKKR